MKLAAAREKRKRITETRGERNRSAQQLHSPAFVGFFLSSAGTAAPSDAAVGAVSMSDVETISKYLQGARVMRWGCSGRCVALVRTPGS